MAKRQVKVVAHRGASAVRPENTLAAFRTAVDLGADAIEFDVHATRDGTLIVHHDYDLSRTTDGEGLVFERDESYVRCLDAGSWFAPEFAGERIPLLAEVLAFPDIEFELELKGSGRAYLEAVVNTVHSRKALDRTEFTSWNVPMLIALKSMVPQARLGLFSRRRETWMPVELFDEIVVGIADFLPADVVHVYAADVNRSVVERLHRLGRTVHANANDAADADEMQQAVDAGADRLSANDVALARYIVSSRIERRVR